MSSWKLLVASLQIIAAIAVYLQRKSLRMEGRREVLAEALAQIAVAADAASELRLQVQRMTDEDLDEVLGS